MSKKNSVLFVCLGNICRSPMAEGIFRHLVKEQGSTSQWTIDSAGTGSWHIGGRADERTLKCLEVNGMTSEHICRQLQKQDFKEFDIIFGMDEQNIEDINSVKPRDATAEVKLLGSYDPEKQLIIEDTYYGGYDGFERAFIQIKRCCEQFLKEKSKA